MVAFGAAVEGPLLVMATSVALMAVACEADSLPGVGSPVVEVIAAFSIIVPLAPAFPITVIVVVPLASDGVVQDELAPVPLQVNEPLVELRIEPPLMVKATVAFVAGSGPALLIVTV